MAKLIFIGALALAALPVGTARAQTPDAQTVIATIEQQAPEFAPCLESIAARESRFDPSAVNPTSGARGVFQWLPYGGEWQSTPYGSEPVAVASIAEEVAAAAWALSIGDGPRAWQTQTLPACGGVS